MGPLEDLIRSLSRFPSMGKKTATRLAFFLLKAEKGFVKTLAQQIGDIQDRIRKCSRCGNFTEHEVCEICRDASRDGTLLCVVEQVQDLMNLQTTGEFRGLYFVLHGMIAPLEGVGPEQLRLGKLVERVRDEGVREVILATNSTIEGDTTALYIHKLLAPMGVVVTRLASGIPVGGDLEYADRLTLARSLKARTTLS